MPSAALVHWRNDRVSRLTAVESQCAAVGGAAIPSAQLVDENLRGYVVLLSAHFQGFCRDLYTEAALRVAAAVPPSLRVAIQAQCESELRLGSRNPTLDSLTADFDRFGFNLRTALAGVPVPPAVLSNLAVLNRWRNYVAHHDVVTPPGGPLSRPLVRSWQASCDTLATAIDRIMYNHLRAILGVSPW